MCPDTGIARVAGNVRITRGQNQLDGSEAEVDMKTGISRLLAGNTGRVQGLVVPNDQANQPAATSTTGHARYRPGRHRPRHHRPAPATGKQP